MEYIKVFWYHDAPQEPVVLYAELDDERWEMRKVDVFENGSYGFASKTSHTSNTYLGELPVPSIEEIKEEAEFDPFVITQEEFEKVWLDALVSAGLV